MTRFRATLAWLCAGHAVLGGLYWLLLRIPESNAWMLAASLLVVFAAAWLAGVVEMTAFLALRERDPMSAALKISARRAWLVVLPLAAFAAFWWLTAAAADWHARHASQIDAWIIASTGSTRTAWLHAGFAWAIAFLRYGVGTALAAALLGALASHGFRGLVSGWIPRGLMWKPLLVTSAALLIGIWLPWHAVYWRPASLPPTWAQPAFAAVKLLLLYVAGNLAWAVVLRTASRQP